MAHFAELDDTNTVLRVVVISNDDLLDADGVESEELGIKVCRSIFGSNTNWKQTSYNKTIRGHYAGIGSTYSEELDIFIPVKPNPWFILNENYEWECPRDLDPDTGQPWPASHYIELRYSNLYRLEPVVLKDPENWTSGSCVANDYTIKQIEEITHGENKSIDPFITETGELDFSIARATTIIDLTPVCTINHYMLNDFNGSEKQTDVIKHFHRIHPQSVGITLQELFRLIIEWAWAYRELGNTEPMAELSDKVLRIVQMPLDVRNELLELPYQSVGRFLQGQDDYAEIPQEEPHLPLKFKTWIQKITDDFKVRNPRGPVIEDIPETYPL